MTIAELQKFAQEAASEVNSTIADTVNILWIPALQLETNDEDLCTRTID